MPKLRSHRDVGPDYVADAPRQVAVSHEIPTSANTLFASLAGAADWKIWLGLDVAYTSDPSEGVGTTRTVKKGPVTIEEYFFTWEPGRRLGFRAVRSTLPVAAFAEDYVISPMGDDRCRLDWTIGFEAEPSLLGPVQSFALRRQGKQSLPELAALFDGRGRPSS